MNEIMITVNGEVKTVSDNMNLSYLITHLQLDSKKIAIERNFKIVPRAKYGCTKLFSGDTIEIVQFVGGG